MVQNTKERLVPEAGGNNSTGNKPSSNDRMQTGITTKRSGNRLNRALIIGASLVGVVVVILAVYGLLIRPWYMTLGSTETEKSLVLPGDELVPAPAYKVNMAITINAPSETVWPWLLQIGNYRGGWYSYDAVESTLGSADFIDGHSLNNIAPALQNLKVGDRIDITWKDAPLSLKVLQIEPGRTLVMRWATNGRADGPTWVYFLNKVDNQTTRLIMRALNKDSVDIATLIMEPGEFAMYHKSMVGIKERAERSWQSQLLNGAAT